MPSSIWYQGQCYYEDVRDRNPLDFIKYPVSFHPSQQTSSTLIAAYLRLDETARGDVHYLLDLMRATNSLSSDECGLPYISKHETELHTQSLLNSALIEKRQDSARIVENYLANESKFKENPQHKKPKRTFFDESGERIENKKRCIIQHHGQEDGNNVTGKGYELQIENS